MNQPGFPARLIAAALLLLLAGLAGACGRGASGPAAPSGAIELPPLPRASRALLEGDAVVFHGVAFVLEEMGSSEGVRTARVASSGRGGGQARTIEVGSFAFFGDILAQAAERPGPPGAPPRPGITLSLYHLPGLRSARTGDLGTFVVLEPGNLRFLRDGFLFLVDVDDADPARSDDDQAEVILGLSGEVHRVVLREFTGLRLPGASLAVRNAWPNPAGGGSAELALHDGGFPWPGAIEEAELLVEPGRSASWRELSLSASVVPGRAGVGARVLVELEDSLRGASLLLRARQSWRWGPWSIEVSDVPESGPIPLRVALHDEDILPTTQGVAAESASGRRTAQPDEVSRKFAVGAPFDFHGARFELRRTYAPVPGATTGSESLPVAEFRFLHGQTLETRRLQRGWRTTFHAGEQWWIVEVDEVDPYPLPNGGTATVKIRRGRFGLPETQRGPIVAPPGGSR